MTKNQQQVKSPNVSTYMQLGNEINQAQQDAINTATIYTNMQQSLNEDDAMNTSILNALINMHINLLSTNAYIKQRIAPMQTNCMKGSPSVVGGCR